MKMRIFFISATFILFLTPMILKGSNILEISFFTTLNSTELLYKASNYDGPPAIPNIIWGNVYINGIKITSENECTLTLKIGEQIYATYKMGQEKKYGDLYRFVIPAYSKNIDIFILYNGTFIKAYSISSVKTAEIIRHDISIITNRSPEPPGLLAQLTSDYTDIPANGTIYERSVCLKGYVSDPDNDKVKLQIELKKIRNFSIYIEDTILYESEFYESGNEICLSIEDLSFASYKWRARSIDENGNSSEWICFGNNDIDFTVEPCLKVSQTAYNFNDIEIGTYEDWEFTISNLGNKPVILNQISSSDSAFIVVSPSFPYELPSKSNLNIKLRFAPVEIKTYRGTINIITDEFPITDFNLEEIGLNITLIGKGKEGKPDLKPTCITFSTKPIVMEKTFIKLTIKNDGNKISPNGPLRLKLFVYDKNEKPIQGNILDVGNIENIESGKSIDISFWDVFVSSEVSSYLEVEILPKNSMDCDLTNNIIRVENFDPQSNPLPFLNFVGELLTIVCSGLLEGIEKKELIESIISYANEQFINNYDLLIEETDIDKIVTFCYRTIMNNYRNILKLKDRALMAKFMSCVRVIAHDISIRNYPLVYRIMLREIFDAFWRAVMQKSEHWSAWNMFLFLLNPSKKVVENYETHKLMEGYSAGLIVENNEGRITSVIDGQITENIDDSFGFSFEDRIVIVIIGSDTYKVKIKGLSNGECDLSVCKPDVEGENLILKRYLKLPISPNSQAHLILEKGSHNDILTFDNNNDGIEDGSFVPDSVENVVLEDVQVVIPLNAGWNLISIPVFLSENDLNNVLQSIAGKYQSVWTYENRWKRYFANAVGTVNDLNKFEVGKGYWINMIEDSELLLKGKQIIDSPLQLNAGWNLVGYTSLLPRTVERAMSSISNRLTSVWTYDGSWKRCIVGAPSQANTLNMMNPGMGYWINVTSQCQWDIRSNVRPAPYENLYCQDAQTNMPQIPCIVFGRLFINGIINKDLYVILKVNGNVYSSYKLGKYNGFYLLEFPQITDSSANLELDVVHGDISIKSISIKNPIAGELMNVDLSVNIPLGENVLYQNFPNPFNPETWIPYSLKSNSNVMIEIYNVSGQLIRTLDLGQKLSGSYINKENAAYWDGTNEFGEKVSSGIYFYTIKTNEYISTRKMILSR
ncbi:MAG: T9SS type A sorting domain-containing protein [bacterium]